MDRATDDLHLEPTHEDFKNELRSATSNHSKAVAALKEVDIKQLNLVKPFKMIDETEICQYNCYYVMYGSEASVENLAWLSDCILNTCEDSLHDKVREGMVGASTLEAGDHYY